MTTRFEQKLNLSKILLSLVLFIPLWIYSEPATAIKGIEAFNTRWVIPFLSNGSWGRGPHSNAESCVDCHNSGTNPYIFDSSNGKINPIVLKIGDLNGKSGHPRYGNELSLFGITGKLPREGAFTLHWKKQKIGQQFIQFPSPQITELGFGELGKSTTTSIRMGRDLTSIGLLESIDENQLKLIVAEQKTLGLNGRINYVIDPITKKTEVGRFGYKASSPSLSDQISKAFRDELGVTSIFYSDNPCAAKQEICIGLNNVGGFEVSEDKINAIAEFLRATKPLSHDHKNRTGHMGKSHFEMAGCSVCHRTDLTATSTNSEHTHTVILYTDLLLHDMGSGLSDGLKEFQAQPEDWRTSPLIGIGEHLRSGGSLLHDGRAKTIEEAILWHEGEAISARDNYLLLKPEHKTLLQSFIKNL